MSNIDIRALLQSVIDGHITTEAALSQITEEKDFETACDIATSNISPSYDHGKMDLGDNWAKLLRDTKLHAIRHLDELQKMKFIANSMNK